MVLLTTVLLIFLFYPAETNHLQNTSLTVLPSKNTPSAGAWACKSTDHNQSGGRQIWHLLRASLYFIELSCLVAYLMRMSPFTCDFTLQMLFCWDCQLQIACGDTSSMQRINIYNIIAHSCYCHNCKQLIKRMYLLCLRVIHSSNIFFNFQAYWLYGAFGIISLYHHCLLCHHLNKKQVIYLHIY